MTVLELIKTIKFKTLDMDKIKSRLDRLIELKAPIIIIENEKRNIEKISKVNGLARKNPVGDVEVKKYEVMSTNGYYFNGYGRTRKPTKVIKMETDKGIYYYDLTGNKIGKDGSELDVSIAGLFRN